LDPGVVVHIDVIVSANGTEDRGFESRQGAKILGFLFFVTRINSSHYYCAFSSEKKEKNLLIEVHTCIDAISRAKSTPHDDDYKLSTRCNFLAQLFFLQTH
jgi:hypothetical protein